MIKIKEWKTSEQRIRIVLQSITECSYINLDYKKLDWLIWKQIKVYIQRDLNFSSHIKWGYGDYVEYKVLIVCD